MFLLAFRSLLPKVHDNLIFISQILNAKEKEMFNIKEMHIFIEKKNTSGILVQRKFIP